MSAIYTDTVTLETLTCGECGIAFGVPRAWASDRRADKNGFYCPNGHCRVFRKSTEQILREKIADQEQRIIWRDEDLKRVRSELQSQKFKTMAERSAKARLKKRISDGVCPCCHRTFANLQKHMAHLHPDFGKEDKGS